jgi:putative transposase
LKELQVSRLRRIEQGDRYFFVTTNLEKNVARFTPAERMLVEEVLAESRTRLGALIFAHVVMPDHLHLLFDPGPSTLTEFMREFKSKSALALNGRRGTRGRVWQARYFDFVCRRVRDFWEKTEHIRNNPVRAGLVKQMEDREWSSGGTPNAGRNRGFEPDFIDLPAEGSTLLWPAPWR